MKYMFILIYSYCVVMFLYVCMSESTINALTTHTARVFLWTNACASIREVSLVQAHIGASLLVVKQLDSIEQFKNCQLMCFPKQIQAFYFVHDTEIVRHTRIFSFHLAHSSRALFKWVNTCKRMHLALN